MAASQKERWRDHHQAHGNFSFSLNLNCFQVFEDSSLVDVMLDLLVKYQRNVTLYR
jgi:hypothetical protein